MKLTPHRRGIIAVLISCLAYGFFPAAMRFVYADGGNAALLVTATTWTRTICLLIACAIFRTPLFRNRADTQQAAIGGLAQAVSVLGMLLALLFIPGPIMNIIIFTHTLMLLFYMAWRGEIKLGMLNLTTTVTALCGLMMVLDIFHQHSSRGWIGMGLAFMAAIATASRLYVYGHQTKSRNPIAVGVENFIFAAPLVTMILLFQAPHLPATSMGLIYVALSCAAMSIATFSMFYGISLLGSFQYSLFAKLEPIVTSIFSVLIVGEVLSIQQYLGIVVVIGSLATYQLVQRKKLN